MTVYDRDNIFAKIIRGDLPSHKVHEDARTCVIMDIMPRAAGHVLVLPKASARNLLDISPSDLCAVMTTAQHMAHVLMRAFSADGVTINQYNEEAGGQMVFHMHVHVIPRRHGEALRPHTGEMADDAVLAAQAARIRDALEKTP